MKNPVRTLTLAVAAAFLAGPAVAQDSVALTDCVGDAITPWDDALATNGSEQRDAFVVDLAPLTTSCGTEFGIAPIVKPSQSSTGFFTSGMGAQSISRVQLEGVPFHSDAYSVWNGQGFGVNNDPAISTPGATIDTTSPFFSSNTSQFGVGFSEFGTTDQGANYNGLVGALVYMHAQLPGRLYVTRYQAAVDGCSDLDDNAAIGFGSIDASGDMYFRADDFGVAGGCGGSVVGNNVLRINVANRDPTVLNSLSGSTAQWDAMDGTITGAGTHSTPTMMPSSIAPGGQSLVLGGDFSAQYVRETIPGTVVTGAGHFGTGATDQRGNFAYSPANIAAIGGTHGTIGHVAYDTAGESTMINMFGLTSGAGIAGTLAVTLPAVITDNDDFTVLGGSPFEFDHYHSQVAFQGGSGNIAMGLDLDGNLIAAGEVDWPNDAGSDWPLNMIAVARINATTGASEWTMAGRNDATGAAGKEIFGGADCNEIIGQQVLLSDVTGGIPAGNPQGPSVSAPMIDAMGNLWFLSAVELFDEFGGPSDFDVALLRAVYDISNFSYKLELVTTTGDVFPGLNSATNWQVRFLGIADANSVSSSGAWSGNMSSEAHSGVDVADISDQRDSRGMGGLVLNVGLTYDRNGDGDYTTCFNGGVDEDYTALVYIGHRFWPDLGNSLSGDFSPRLKGEGNLTAGDLQTVTLEDAPPLTVCQFVIGFSAINSPFKGGVLVPNPDIIVGLPTNASGTSAFPFLWPAGVPGGISIFWQAWCPDAGGPNNFSASNGIEMYTPGF